MRLKLKEVLEKMELNNRQAAQRIGLHRQYVESILEQQPTRISVRTLDRLCRALDCLPADLLELESDGCDKSNCGSAGET